MKNLEQLSPRELQEGYCFSEDEKAYQCLSCGELFPLEEVFPMDGRFFSAKAAAARHAASHGDRLSLLLQEENRYITFTENQKELLSLFSQGLTDNEIAKRLSLSPSTVRHQRFLFREKRKTAKMTLALLELALMGQGKHHIGEELIDVHENAKMVDSRFEITKEEEQKILNGAFSSLSPLRLLHFPPKEKKKIVVLRRISQEFKPGKRYTEKEVNELLGSIHEDFATLRRSLIEYGFFNREKDCSAYWRSQ